MNRSVIANIESGRRQYVDIGEVFELAYALGVAPIHLMVPTAEDQDADEHFVSVTADRWFKFNWLREWIRGHAAPSDTDPRFFYSEVPPNEWGHVALVASGESRQADDLIFRSQSGYFFTPEEAPEAAAAEIRTSRNSEFVGRLNEVGSLEISSDDD